jgi:hypothetical protein
MHPATKVNTNLLILLASFPLNLNSFESAIVACIGLATPGAWLNTSITNTKGGMSDAAVCPSSCRPHGTVLLPSASMPIPGPEIRSPSARWPRFF